MAKKKKKTKVSLDGLSTNPHIFVFCQLGLGEDDPEGDEEEGDEEGRLCNLIDIYSLIIL